MSMFYFDMLLRILLNRLPSESDLYMKSYACIIIPFIINKKHLILLCADGNINMNVFQMVIGIWGSLISAIILEYILKFRPGLSEKFVLKSDCQRSQEQLHNENRQDHKEIFGKLDDLKNIIIDTLKDKGK